MSHSKRKRCDTGRKPSAAEIAEVERIATLDISVLREHPRSITANPAQLRHINTYGDLPEFYIDQVFTCRDCGTKEIWRAHDQQWYYEVAKGHIDAKAVRCHSCRKERKAKATAKKLSP